MNTTTKYLFLFVSLGLSSANKHQWRIQREGTGRVKGVSANDTMIRPIREHSLEPFPADLRDQVKKDYGTLQKMPAGQDLPISYGYSEKTGWVKYSGWRVCLLDDGTMVQKTPKSGTLRIIVPPTIKYGTLVDAAQSYGPGLGLGIGGRDKNNTVAKFSYTSRQGHGSSRLTLGEALNFDNDHFVRFFQKSFETFKDHIPTDHHIHIEWMPIRQEDLDKTVIEWMLIDAGVKFDKKTKDDNTARIDGTQKNEGVDANTASVIATAKPFKTLIRPAVFEAGKSPISLQVCPLRGGKADEGGIFYPKKDQKKEHCANIRNFMLLGSIESVKTVWAEVGRQARKMAQDTDKTNPLRIWTIGGSIGWLHIKMCRDFAGCGRVSVPNAGALCKGWATQCATEQARYNAGVAWHRALN